MAEDGWKVWLRGQLRGTTDPVWLNLMTEVPGMTPRPLPPEPARRTRSKAPRFDPSMHDRAFQARLAGKVRTVVVRCSCCDGDRCHRCDMTGRVKIEPLHPADAWTLARLAEIPPMATGARP